MKAFEFDVKVEKAWKDKDTGKMFVRAIASDDKPDAQADRMTEVALKGMAEQAKKGLPLLETHRSVFAFGKSTAGEVIKTDKGLQFAVEFELDPAYPQAKSLYEEVASDKGTEKQLSIGGKINSKNAKAVRFEEKDGGVVRAVEDVILDHIATTRKSQAANDRTKFVSAILKSLDTAEVEEESVSGKEIEGAPAKPAAEVANKDNKEAPAPVASVGDDALRGAKFLEKLGQTLGKGGRRAAEMVHEEVVMDTSAVKPAAVATPPAAPAVAKTEGTPEPKVSVGQRVREMVAKFVTGGLNQTQLVTELKGLLAAEKSTVAAVEDEMFDAATDTVSKASVGKKRLAQLSEVHASLTRILAELKGEPVVAPAEQATAEKSKVDAEALEKTLAEKFGSSLEKTLETFEKSVVEKVTAQVTAQVKSGLAPVEKTVSELHDVAKDALSSAARLEERVSSIEKAAGVTHALPGDDAPTEEVTKEKKGPWKGMFGNSLSKAQSRM